MKTRATLRPHRPVTPEDVGAQFRGDAKLISEMREELARYLADFTIDRDFQPDDRTLMCVGCGSPLTGLLCGTFEWGAQWGEGHCVECWWPARGLHELKINGENLTFPGILQYAPKHVRYLGDREPLR